MAALGDLCLLCSRYAPTRAVATYVDRFGYAYHLCERHYRPILRWQRQKPGRGVAYRDRSILALAEDVRGPYDA